MCVCARLESKRERRWVESDIEWASESCVCVCVCV